MAKLIASLGCSGSVIIVALLVVAMFVTVDGLLAPNATSICSPLQHDGPELLSPAPESSPATNGPSVAPAAYDRGPNPNAIGSRAFENAALASTQPQNSIPSNYLKLYKAAEQKYGVPWYVLAGVGKVETDHGRSNMPGVHSGENSAGAGGPMQFLQPTFDAYAVDGDHDGRKDRYDPADAIFTAAHYLQDSGAPANTSKALYTYNRSPKYVNLVLSWAKRYGGNNFIMVGANYAGVSCASTTVASSALGQRIVSYAEKWLGTPYLWAAGNVHGPTNGGFDCSGLTMYAVYQATNGQITLTHYTGSQQTDPRGTRVSRSELQPGDLVFFSNPPGAVPHHVGIYVGGGKMVNAPHTGTVVKVEAMDEKQFNGGVRFTMTKKA